MGELLRGIFPPDPEYPHADTLPKSLPLIGKAGVHMFENKPLTEVEESDLQELITTQKQEGKTIDYKLGSVGNTDADKKEFLADVSSFANALGGHLIFGMEEENGIPTNLCGIVLGDPDGEILRLENVNYYRLKAESLSLALWEPNRLKAVG